MSGSIVLLLCCIQSNLLLSSIMVQWMVSVCFVLYCIILYYIVLQYFVMYYAIMYVLLKSSTIRWFGRVRMEISLARTLTSVASTTPYMATCKKSDIKQYSANSYTDTVQSKYKNKHSTVEIHIQILYSANTNTVE